MILRVGPLTACPPTIGEIASSYGISKNHVMKVVHQLGVAGYIETVRGQSGGMRLARSAAEINLGEVVRRTEPDLALVPCFEPINSACVITPACKLRRALHEARAAFLAVLDSYSLGDLIDRLRAGFGGYNDSLLNTFDLQLNLDAAVCSRLEGNRQCRLAKPVRRSLN